MKVFVGFMHEGSSLQDRHVMEAYRRFVPEAYNVKTTLNPQNLKVSLGTNE